MNKLDFLNGITGKAVDFNLEGVGTIKVKGLSVLAMKELRSDYGDDEIGAAVGAVQLGMADPVLDKEDLDALFNANPGLVMKIAERITQLSGLEVEDDNSPN